MKEKILKKIRGLLPRTRKSNPISKLLRPVFGKHKFKSFVGLQIIGFSVLVSVVSLPAQALDYSITQGEFVRADYGPLVTESTFQLPIEEYLGVTQGFHRMHPAVDIKARVGEKVLPVKAGRVKEVGYLRYGYGHYVLVEHNGGIVSLYAHLGKIEVEKGQPVLRGSVLGEVGMTGWTTGPHLHLEILKDNRYLNPMRVIEGLEW